MSQRLWEAASSKQPKEMQELEILSSSFHRNGFWGLATPTWTEDSLKSSLSPSDTILGDKNLVPKLPDSQ